MEERIIAADPVADPQGYRRELLALLGHDDPAEVLAATLAELQEQAGIHAKRGPTSFRVATDEIAGHARAHQLQLEQTIAAVRR